MVDDLRTALMTTIDKELCDEAFGAILVSASTRSFAM
jgi:hypothetical protein